MRTTTKATAGIPAPTSGAKPVFQRSAVWLRLAFSAVVIVCVLVPAGAFVLAERYAGDAVARHEGLVAGDIAASVDRILNSLRSRHADALPPLVGRPCRQIFAPLAEAETRLRYLRAIALVNGGRLTCSSALGAIDAPLDVYVRAPVATPAADGTRITLLPETPYQRGIPVLAAFRATARDAGVLYLIEGDYVADALAHSGSYGAESATLSIAGAGRLDHRGRFIAASRAARPRGTAIASRAWPFTVSVVASAQYVSQVERRYRLLFGTIALLVDALVVAAYLIATAPRRLLLKAVGDALRRNEFHVVYQPVVEIETRRTVGVEALLRWHHPKWGAISPTAFVPQVESSAVLPRVTEYVLRTAVSELTALAPAMPLRIAINVAPKDLERPRFMSIVDEAIRRLPPGFTLVLEVTERVLLEKNPRTTAMFAALRAKGVKFAIDDFGTQHSNLDMLTRFPFDYVKIDRQFVAQLDGGSARLIEGIAAVAHHYGLKIVAEGVETEEQHRALHAVGIQYAQGYLYQRPQRAEHLKDGLVPAPA
ncbi:EAL domain-containing protein [Burkholderia multivorans]|uniref:EAL domain-containing protein n=1 Tax=Burkholderia multivorans TaxID=87883 RepID=UPI0020B44035|nr:EAL domain-containing protein [Burkholderia multivorans]